MQIFLDSPISQSVAQSVSQVSITICEKALMYVNGWVTHLFTLLLFEFYQNPMWKPSCPLYFSGVWSSLIGLVLTSFAPTWSKSNESSLDLFFFYYFSEAAYRTERRVMGNFCSTGDKGRSAQYNVIDNPKKGARKQQRVSVYRSFFFELFWKGIYLLCKR